MASSPGNPRSDWDAWHEGVTISRRRLVFDNFFNVRLVIDTGMNFFGWSRPKAMLYMREHTLESDVQIDSETIRYSVRSPAQALAYRMGRQAFVRLRAKAEAALGDQFDVREFHEAVLSVGSMPLTTVERHVDWWIAQQRTDPVRLLEKRQELR